VHDRNHTPHEVQTTLGPAQEAVMVVLRTTLLVSIDALLARHWASTNGAFNGPLREFLNAAVSRSGLDRCLRRHGVG